jgi:hypothetical protein
MRNCKSEYEDHYEEDGLDYSSWRFHLALTAASTEGSNKFATWRWKEEPTFVLSLPSFPVNLSWPGRILTEASYVWKNKLAERNVYFDSSYLIKWKINCSSVRSRLCVVSSNLRVMWSNESGVLYFEFLSFFFVIGGHSGLDCTYLLKILSHVSWQKMMQPGGAISSIVRGEVPLTV